MQKEEKEAIDLLAQAKLDRHGMLTEQIRILQSQLKGYYLGILFVFLFRPII